MKPNTIRLLQARAMFVFALMLVMPSISVYAECQNNNEQGTDQNQQHPPRREPPPQAYEDCKGRKAGDVVQITTPRGDKLSATCTDSPKGLFARPARPPRDQGNDQGGGDPSQKK